MTVEKRYFGVGTKINTQDHVEAIQDCGLNYRIKKLEMQSCKPIGDLTDEFLKGDFDPNLHLTMPRYRGVYKDNGTCIGVVGKNYEVIQNVEAAEVPAAVIEHAPDDMNIRFSHGGEIFDGEKVFLDLSIGDPIEIQGEPFQKSAVCVWSHDGGLALKFAFMMHRVRSNRLLPVNIGDMPSETKVRHTLNARDRMNQAKKVLISANEVFDSLTSRMNLLSATAMTDPEFAAFLKELIPAKDDTSDRSVTVARNKRKAIVEQYHAGQGSAAHRGTLLGGFLAVNEWAAEKTTRVTADRKPFGEGQVKLNGTLFGARGQEVASAFKALVAKTQ